MLDIHFIFHFDYSLHTYMYVGAYIDRCMQVSIQVYTFCGPETNFDQTCQ